MPMVNPLMNGDTGGMAAFGGSVNPTTTARRAPDAGGSPPVGTGNLRSGHNTPLHCAGIILLALAIVFGLKWAGFRFAFDVGMGRS